MYKRSIAEYREQYDPIGCEVLIERQNDADELFRLYRIDLASGSVEPPDFTEVNPESFVSFDRVDFSLNGMRISLYPIYWNGVQFEISPPIDQLEIRKWAYRWIDIDETSDTDEYGLGNYLHSITEPTTSNGVQEFSIDFGSSESTAMLELIEIFSNYGARSLRMHSSSITGLDMA